MEIKEKTAIIYARASTQEQSTKIQVEQLEKFCKANGIEIKEIYQENISGAKEHREQLEVILESEPKADLLVIREISRLSREVDYMAALEKVRRLTTKYSLYVLLDDYYIQKNEVIDLATGITMMVKLYGAAEEREKIKDRTSAARTRYRENPINVSTGTRYIPFGLMKATNPNYEKGVNTKNIWVKNPKEWDKVMKIFELKKQGLSYSRISDITGLTESIIIQTIKSPKIRYYVDESLLVEVDEKTELNNTNPSPTKHTNKYRNKIFFEDTSIAMSHSHTVKNGFQYVKKGGNSGSIKEKIIDDIAKIVINFALDVKEEKLEIIRQKNQGKIDNLEEIIQGLNNSLQSQTTEIEKLRKKFVLTDDEVILKELNERVSELKKNIDSLSQQIFRYTKEKEKLESLSFNEGLIEINENNFQTFIDRYIDSIRCFHTGKFQHRIEVKTSNLWEDFVFVFEVYHHNNYTIVPVNMFDEALRNNLKYRI